MEGESPSSIILQYSTVDTEIKSAHMELPCATSFKITHFWMGLLGSPLRDFTNRLQLYQMHKDFFLQ